MSLEQRPEGEVPRRGNCGQPYILVFDCFEYCIQSKKTLFTLNSRVIL